MCQFNYMFIIDVVVKGGVVLNYIILRSVLSISIHDIRYYDIYDIILKQ